MLRPNELITNSTFIIIVRVKESAATGNHAALEGLSEITKAPNGEKVNRNPLIRSAQFN